MKYNKQLLKIKEVARVKTARLLQWWLRKHKVYGRLWVAGNILAALLILFSIAMPIFNHVLETNRYELSASTLKLVGNTDSTLQSRLTYDANKQMYQFNKDAVKDSSNPLQGLQSQVGTASKKDKSLYALDVPQDFSKGVTYHDINSQLSFSLVPKFDASQGKQKQGHLIFPVDGNMQAIYTLKNNGLKEDLVLPKVTRDTMTFSYNLKLPKTLEAKVIPESGGAIGIYSADPSLFGNISYGSEKDKAMVQKAREQGAKTFLVFGLPAPVIKTSNGVAAGKSSARFELRGNQLSVVAEGLSGLKGPISIDPSVVVTSTSDFQTSGNNEGNIDFSTSGQITRGALTGGTVGTWAYTYNSTSSSTNPSSIGLALGVYGHATVAYNGYLYVVGGYSGADVNYLQYAPISSSNGTIGSWTTSSHTFTNGRSGLSAIVYSGYIYILGGMNTSFTYYNDVQYAPIQSSGDVGAWASTSSFTNGRTAFGAAAYNGYMYISGGCVNTAANCNSAGRTFYNDVQYAAINADGTLGSWASTTAFTTARDDHGSMAYNGFLYIVGGYNGTTGLADIQYAPLKSDGTLGAWRTNTTSLIGAARIAETITASGGYIYVLGGFTSTYVNDVQYAAINADGSVGNWGATSSFTTARAYASSVVYNGYVYQTGGYTGAANLNDVQFTKVDPAGMVGTFVSGGTLGGSSVARRGSGVAAYNGYIYVVGGDDGTTASTATYYAPINSDGSLGTWSTGTALAAARVFPSVLAIYGFLYVFDGCTTGTAATCTTGTADGKRITIASNGSISTAWSTVTTFTARFGAQIVTYQGRLFVAGGYNSGYLSDVLSATLSGTGSVGSWSATGATALPSARAYYGSAFYNGKWYIAGGYDGTTYKSDVIYTSLTSSGNGAWSTASNSFTNGRSALSLSIDRGYLYINGGYNGTTYYADTQFAPLTATGDVSAWTAGSSFSTGRYQHASVVTGGYMYVIAGSNGTVQSDVQFAPVNNGGSGSPGTWTSSTSLASTVSDQGTIAYNGYLYSIGGTNLTTYNTSSNYALICTGTNSGVGGCSTTAGAVGTWASTGNTLAVATADMAVAAANGYIYVMGGWNGTTAVATVYYALACTGTNSGTGGCGATAGTLGTWNSTTSFTTGRYGLSGVAVNGYLYIMGGAFPHNPSPTAQNDVQYALICTGSNSGTGGCSATAGTVGTWATTTAFTTARLSQSTVTVGGYMYIVGGQTGGGTAQSDVQYALICTGSNSGTGGCSATAGTVGTWITAVNFNVPRYGQTVVAYNGFMYIIGGYNGTTYFNDVQYAPINAGGGTGNWTVKTGFTTARQGHGSAVYDGYAYIVGGSNGTAQSDTQYVPLGSMARTANYSKIIDLVTAVTVTGFSYNGVTPPGSLITYKTAGGGGVFGVPGLCMGNVSTSTYAYVSVSLDDSSTAVFPDSLGTTANVTDMTVTYNFIHPAPNIRLRGGQTFQAATAPSAFDTCSP